MQIITSAQLFYSLDTHLIKKNEIHDCLYVALYAVYRKTSEGKDLSGFLLEYEIEAADSSDPTISKEHARLFYDLDELTEASQTYDKWDNKLKIIGLPY